MQRYTHRLLVALVTFCLGVCVFKAINLLENVIVQHYYPVSDIQSVAVPINDTVETNEIYNVVLQTLKDAHVKPLFVQSESEGYIYIDYSPDAPRDTDPQTKFAKTVQHLMPDAETETLNNYLVVNKVSETLKISAPDLNVTLVPPPDFSNGSGWETFYKAYPNASALIFLSQVGFNSRHDQAIVYRARGCGGLCGGGSYFLLSKTDGKWIILRHELLWIS